MTLLSPLFLLFGLTAAVPLVLHLYQQRQRTILLYSSNRFFTQSILRSQRRMRVRRILLLLLRMAACLFLACAAAQPLLSLLGFGAGAGDRDVVIVIDDSLSMQAPADAPHFERARQLALGLLGELGGGDRAAVLTATGKSFGRTTAGGVKLTSDIAHLAAEVQGLSATSAAGDYAEVLAHAAQVYDNTGRRAHVLVALSDLQASDWPAVSGSGGWPQPAQPTGG